MAEDQKKRYFGNYTAEFNTGQDSLEQLAVIEWTISNLFVEIWDKLRINGDLSKIHSLYDWLIRIYYRRLYAMMWETSQRWFEHGEVAKKKKVEGKEITEWIKKSDLCFDEIERLYWEWQRPENNRRMPLALVQSMEKFHTNLLEEKQKKMNLGIPMRKEQGLKERLGKL